MGEVRAVLVDIDGVLTVSWRPLPGTVEALRRLRDQGLAVRLLTNTTSRTRASIAATLREAGFPVGVDDIVTAPAITAAYLTDHYPDARCLLLNSGDVREDLPGVRLMNDEPGRSDEEDVPDVVVIGGAGPEFGYETLNRIFGHLRRGARLVAMHRNLYWRTDEGLRLDTGAFLMGLEKASGKEAEVVGKPSAAFFATALAALGADPAHALMVGDDIEADVLAAQRSGITGVLVRTGKYLPETHRNATGTPDHVVDSFADLPALLERPAG
jgi:HAD superfamily hydrolase (TIGR01458 family)